MGDVGEECIMMEVPAQAPQERVSFKGGLVAVLAADRAFVARGRESASKPVSEEMS